jgi:predicted unusual protein kinase regulating ubiquinone biosynthesis (AarF/ABC1/UbiB family)
MPSLAPADSGVLQARPETESSHLPTKKAFSSRIHRLFRLVWVAWVLGGFFLLMYRDVRRARKRHDGAPAAPTDPADRLRAQASQLRERLIRLGPTYIKIGQALATRADLLPIPYVEELSKLQNRVPPFPTSEAFAIIERELGRPVRELFAEITPEPIAAASLGQVYRARLHAGDEVAVKVQRPNLSVAVAEDLSVLRQLARWMMRSGNIFKGNDWLGMIDEFERVIHEEMDYRNEARNAERFANNFSDWTNVHVPTIFWSHTARRVLTMEFLRGIQVTDLDGLTAAGINARSANELMYRTYFKQLFEDGFFHADPHPGNILILHDGRLAFFDFGMVGRISSKLQSQMVSAFFHILDRDYDGIVRDLIGLQFLSPDANLEEFKTVVIDLFRRKLDVNLAQVRFKDLTYDLGELVYRYPFSTPASFTFIIRAMMTLEGISITMNPEFNFIEVAKPYARDFLFRRESAFLREQVWESLHDAKSGRLNWGRLLNLARTAISLYLA